MLRITTRTEATETVFELEGTLTGLWVRELERCWEEASRQERPVKVMLKTVTFVDPEGRKLLARMHASGAKLAAEGCMTRAIIDQIVGGENS